MHHIRQVPKRSAYLIALMSLFLLVAPLMVQGQSGAVAPVNYSMSTLNQAWADYKTNYITTSDAGPAPRQRVVIGPYSSTTYSEGQAYGMMFAALFDEQELFDGLWLFAADHLDENGLMHWLNQGYQNVTGQGGATDADVDMGIALITACQKVRDGAWGTSPNGIDYCGAANSLINAIWDTEIDHPGPGPYAGLDDNDGYELIPGDLWNLKEDFPDGIINFSYFAPAYFRVFQEFTGNTGWQQVIDRNYEIAQTAQGNSCAGFVSNWNNYEGGLQTVPWHGSTSEYWGWDAARYAWRVAMDRYWFDSAQSREAINPIGSFFASVGIRNIRAEYRLDGTAVNAYENQYFTSNAASAIWAASDLSATSCGDASGQIITGNGQQAYNYFIQKSDNTYFSDSWRLLNMLLMTGNFPNPLEGAVVEPTPTPSDTPTPEPTEPTDEPTDEPTPENQPPIVEDVDTQTNDEGDTVNLQIVASDPEGEMLRYDAQQTLPPGLQLNPANGVISGTLAAGSAGTYNVVVVVLDPDGLQGQTSFNWIVQGDAPQPPPSSDMIVELQGNGPDNNQQTQFSLRIRNESGSAQSNISLRLYFTVESGQDPRNYVLEKYWDQSGSATVSQPMQVQGNLYYFQIDYGSATLGAGEEWEYHGALHLGDWTQNINTNNDWWKAGGLPPSYAVSNFIPLYVNGVLVSGQEPTSVGNPPQPTTPPTVAPTNTPIVLPTNTPIVVPTSTPQPPQPQPTNNPPPGGGQGLEVRLRGTGTDNNQQSQFQFRVVNTSGSPQSNIAVRLYFTVENGNPATNYILERYWDQSGSATISGPTQYNGNVYYYTITYGGTLQGMSHWEYQGALRLSNWAQTFNSHNDYWRSGGYSNNFSATSTIPLYQNGNLVWGSNP